MCDGRWQCSSIAHCPSNYMSAIVIDNVSRQFPREPKPAVDRVSLTVNEGEFVVLLGPSGSGKTTLMKMVNRLYEPSSGRIFIGEADTSTISATELRRRIGYVIQQTGLFPHMRVEQNISVVPQLLGWERPRIDQRIDELLELVNLPLTYRRRYPRQLSGGEQQRVGLARALAADPAIMLMDEPFGAIDAINRGRLQDELLNIQRKVHKTVMFVTHDVEEALRLADRIVIMRDGKLVQFDTPLQIVTNPRDTFVQNLVGTEDMLRRLSLISVGSLLGVRDGDGGLPPVRATPELATIGPDEDLRGALSILLRSGAEELAVIGKDGEALGRVSFGDMRAAVAELSTNVRS